VESDARIRRETTIANSMEKARLKGEARADSDSNAQALMHRKKKVRTANGDRPTAATGDTGATAPKDKKNHSKKKNEPEFFTARVTLEKTKPSTAK